MLHSIGQRIPPAVSAGSSSSSSAPWAPSLEILDMAGAGVLRAQADARRQQARDAQRDDAREMAATSRASPSQAFMASQFRASPQGRIATNTGQRKAIRAYSIASEFMAITSALQARAWQQDARGAADTISRVLLAARIGAAISAQERDTRR